MAVYSALRRSSLICGDSAIAMAHGPMGNLTTEAELSEPDNLREEVPPPFRNRLVIKSIRNKPWRCLHALPVNLKACFCSDIGKVQVRQLAQHQELSLQQSAARQSMRAACLHGIL